MPESVIKVDQRTTIVVSSFYNWLKRIDSKMTVTFNGIFWLAILAGVVVTWDTWRVLIPLLVGAFYGIPFGLLRWEQYLKMRSERIKEKKKRRISETY